jgi:dTDP-4-dehydrorhamnose reductase
VRLVVTGAGGQLGRDLVRLAPDAVALGRADLDVTDAAAVLRSLSELVPHTVVNCAAYTAVDAAETDEDSAMAVNAVAPGALAAACAKVGARLVHVSTDYVFPGTGDRPYEVDDDPAPGTVYGRSKLAGERAVRDALPAAGWVVRTSWLYGQSGRSFVTTMLRLEREQEVVEVVDDQHGSPTWSRDLAAGLLELAGAGGAGVPPGVYHATGGGRTTWYGLARAVFEEIGADPSRVHPVPTSAHPRPAARPAFSVLSDRSWQQAGLTPLRPWRAALRAAFSEAGPALRAGGSGLNPPQGPEDHRGPPGYHEHRNWGEGGL